MQRMITKHDRLTSYFKKVRIHPIFIKTTSDDFVLCKNTSI